ncbi:uncharacterized protein METZ01_LOCUS144838, partial [marine metagenome]
VVKLDGVQIRLNKYINLTSNQKPQPNFPHPKAPYRGWGQIIKPTHSVMLFYKVQSVGMIS